MDEREARERLVDAAALTERRLDVAGVSTAVLNGGDGPPVVLLHGGIECGGIVWAPVTARLAERHRVVIPDLPGLGESEPAPGLDAAFADWLAALLRLTCQGRPVVIAHSLAGGLVARFAAAHAGLIRALVLYGASGIGAYRMPFGLRVVAIRFGLRPTERNAERFDRWAFADFDRFRRQAPDFYEIFSRYTRSRAVVPHVKRTMRQLIEAGTMPVPDADLRTIDAETALLWGRHDRFVPIGLAEAARSRFGWPLGVIDAAGHVPHIEQPDAFLAALTSMTTPQEEDSVRH